MGTRTKVMKTTKNQCYYQNYLKNDSKSIPSILILFHSVPGRDRSIIGKWFHSLGRR